MTGATVQHINILNFTENKLLDCWEMYILRVLLYCHARKIFCFVGIQQIKSLQTEI